MEKLDFLREVKRKVFHCLSLVYLAAYHLLGAPITTVLLSVWVVVEGGLEAARLRDPRLNSFLMRFFGGIHRPGEESRVSGVFWTSLGCLATVVFFSGHPRVVTASFLFLALGDGAAALVGKAFGRIRFSMRGRTKSLEGSAACLAACLAAGWAAGLTPGRIIVGAVTATLVELLPVPLDDNFWLPLLSAAAILLVS